MENVSVDYVQEWKYLGSTITNGKRLSFSVRPDLTSFFRATYAVINVLSDAHPHVLVSLLYSNCVPILTYACAVKEYSSAEMSDCNLAINNVFHKIFGFKEWQSIRAIRQYLGVKSIYEIFKVAQDKFLETGRSHSNLIVRRLITLT